MAKRKRPSSPTGEGATGSSSPAAPSPRKSKKSRSGSSSYSTPSTAQATPSSSSTDSAKVDFSLVGSGKTYSRKLDSKKSLDSLIPKIAKEFGVSVLGLRLVHVRAGGVEQEIWDDFDFQAVKARAHATKSKTETVRVYSALLGSQPATPEVPAPAVAKSSNPAPVAVDKGKARDTAPAAPVRQPNSVIATPKSALRTPGNSDTPRSQKRVIINLPSDSPPSTPTPPSRPAPAQVSKPTPPKQLTNPPLVLANGPAAATTATKRRRRRKSSNANEGAAASATPQPTAASPPSTSTSPTALPVSAAAAKYKPARPSPLSQAAHAEPDDGADQPAAKKAKTVDLPTASPVTASPVTTAKVASPAAPRPAAKKAPAASASPSNVKIAPKPAPEPKKRRASDFPPIVGTVPVVGTVPPVVETVTPVPGPVASPAVGSTSAPAPSNAESSTTAAKAPLARRKARTSSASEAVTAASTAAPAAPVAPAAAAAPSSPAPASPRKIAPAPASPRKIAPAPATPSRAPRAPSPTKASTTPSVVPDYVKYARPGESLTSTIIRLSPSPSSREEAVEDVESAVSVAQEEAQSSVNATAANGEENTAPAQESASLEAAEPANGLVIDAENEPSPEAAAVQPPASDSYSNNIPCALCGKEADHIHRDCPAVAAGVDRLRERLEERRAELVRMKEAANAKPRRPSAYVTAADIEAEYEESSDTVCDSIKQWISRLTSVAAKVNTGTPRPGASPKKPAPAANNFLSIGNRRLEPSAPSTPLSREAVARASEDSESSMSSAASTPAVGANGVNTPETPFYPQAIHLKALARPRRPGSMSGLSVSDAVIETGDSASESSSSESESTSSYESESSSESDGNDSDDSSSEAGDVDPADLMRQIMTQPLSKRQKRQARASAASMHPVEAGEAVSDSEHSDDELQRPATQRRGSDSSIGDLEDADPAGPAEPESDGESEAEKARREAILSEVVAETTMTVEEPDSSASSSSDSSTGAVTPNGNDAAEEADSDSSSADSSVGTATPKDGDAVKEAARASSSPDSSTSAVTPDSNDAAVEEAASDDAMDVDEPAPAPAVAALKQPESSQASSPSSRSRKFNTLAERVGESPVMDDLPGDIALREVIIDEADDQDVPPPRSSNGPEPSSSFTPTQVDVPERESAGSTPAPTPPPPAPPVEPPKRRGRPPKNPKPVEREPSLSPPPAEEEASETSSQPVRRSTRSTRALPASQPTPRVTRAASKEPPASQPPARATRAASREAAASQPTTRMTRTASRDSSQLPARVTRAASRDSPPATQPTTRATKATEPPSPLHSQATSHTRSTRTTRGSASSDPLQSSPVLPKRLGSNAVIPEEPELDFEASQVSGARFQARMENDEESTSLPPSSLPPAAQQPNGTPSSSVAASSQAQPVVPETQSSPVRRRTRLSQSQEDAPLFMTQPSQLPETQAYNPLPPALLQETQAPESMPAEPSSNANGKPEDDSDDGLSALSSDDEGAGKSLYPPLPVLNFSRRSQPVPQPSSSIPTLGSLPKDLLRQGRAVGAGMWSALTRSSSAANGATSSQPAVAEAAGNSSESGSDTDSDDDYVNEAVKARYAGSRRKSRGPRTSGIMKGW
ncbi:hypothetical protein Q8F55_004670 [Vanrija albida]|uniref:CCHC-type domain-containing protein n=1 Tax=Vanrija albida TaxID=181172 RepID=A0ABR3Q7D3_9TREE